MKKKIITLITSFVAGLICMTSLNSVDAYAFGGEYTITDPNGSKYTKEAPTQISTSFDSQGNLIVDGYSFFTYVQQYMSKGTGGNNTHYYRLKINNGGGDTLFIYNDVLIGGDDYTSIADDASIKNATAGTTVYCEGKQTYDTQLKQVSFKFIIPAKDLGTLNVKDTYKLVLEHNLTNVKFKSTGSVKTHKLTFNITKLTDINFQKESTKTTNVATANGNVNKITLTSSSNFKALRVNAMNVVARKKNSDGTLSKESDYQKGYFVNKTDTSMKDNVRSVGSSPFILLNKDNDLLGATYVPLLCKVNKTNTTTTKTTYEMTLEELFKKYPSYEYEYNRLLQELKDTYYQRQIVYYNTLFASCKDYNHEAVVYRDAAAYFDMNRGDQGLSGDYSVAQKVKFYVDTLYDGKCPCCLEKYYSYDKKIKEIENKIAIIEAKCHETTTSTSTSTSKVLTELYCKAIYLEGLKGIDYATYINAELVATNVNVISKRVIEKVNSTELEEAKTVDKDPIKKLIYHGVNTAIDYDSSTAGVVCPTGYHLETIVQEGNIIDMETVEPNIITSLNNLQTKYNKRYSITGNVELVPNSYINVTYTFRNDAPVIIPK